jgi:hypothetical protein
MRGSKRFFASASFSGAVLLVAAACARRGGAVASASDSGGATAESARAPASGVPDRGQARDTGAPANPEADRVPKPETEADAAMAPSADARAGDPYLVAEPVAAKSIGHTSFVLKIRLENGLVAAYKPRSKLPLGDRRYKGEIAAYRLGRALGLDNVPIAMPRAFDASRLRRAFATPEGAEDFERRALPDANGTLRGALMPWIDRYEPLAIEEGPERLRWERWLTDATAPVPDEDRPMARALSTMLVFDYVTGNWDRWSGGNVVRDGGTGRLLYVDNDGAFYASPPAQSLTKQLAQLRRVVRFSRSFVASLRAADEATLRDALGEDLGGEPLLPQRTVADVDARRRTVLGVIDAQIGRAGESETLAFE